MAAEMQVRERAIAEAEAARAKHDEQRAAEMDRLDKWENALR